MWENAGSLWGREFWTQEAPCRGAAAGLIFAAVVLVLVVLLENLSSLLPSVPAVLQPTSQLFTVLKKGAVYSLVAVSMNLLNGFTDCVPGCGVVQRYHYGKYPSGPQGRHG